MNSKRIILDTDIGTDVDDAMALSLVLASPELELVGVTTVHADTSLRARLARALLRRADREDVSVVAGASLPLSAPLPPNFHWMPVLRGHEGVGVLEAHELERTLDLEHGANDAAQFIVEQARKGGALSLITIGSLSNIARALMLEPNLKDFIKDITLMGSTVYADLFPFPPMLETNFNCDPSATQIVFKSGIPLTIVPMEITTQVYLVEAQRQRMRAWNAPLSNALVEMMDGMLLSMDSLSSEVGLSEDFYQGRTFMHDPLAVAVAFDSSLVTVQPLHIKLEIIDQTLRTMPYPNLEPNVRVAVAVQAEAFVNFWLERIEAVSKAAIHT